MGMKTNAFKCPHCGQQMGETQAFAPNWTVVDTSRPKGWAVVVLSCTNNRCQAALGSYAYPLPQ
jgi:hypothetical protein